MSLDSPCSVVICCNPLFARLTLNSPDADIVLEAQGLDNQAAQSEWTLAMTYLIFIGSYAIEFRHSYFEAVCTDKS